MKLPKEEKAEKEEIGKQKQAATPPPLEGNEAAPNLHKHKNLNRNPIIKRKNRFMMRIKPILSEKAERRVQAGEFPWGKLIFR